MISFRHAAFKALALPTTSAFTSSVRFTPNISPLQFQQVPPTSFFGRRWNTNYADQPPYPAYDNAQQQPSSEAEAAVPRADAADTFAAGRRPVPVRFGASMGNAAPGPRRSLRPPPEPSNTIYIGNLFYDINEEQLKAHLEQFGQVEAVRVVYDTRGMSKGFGYARMDSLESARRTMESLHMSIFEGRRLAVNYAHSPDVVSNQESVRRRTNAAASKEPTSTLFVGNLPFDITDRDLNDLFCEIPNLRDVRVSVDRAGMPRGFAHADFLNIESAVKAYEMLQGQVMYGRTLRVDYTLNLQDNKRRARDSYTSEGNDSSLQF